MNVLITGTSSGIGFGLTMEYLKGGNTVFGISRQKNEKLMQHENYHHLSQDITEFNYCAIHTANFVRGIEKFHMVILNSGILNQIKELRNTTIEELQESMNVNVWGNKIVLDTVMKISEVEQVVTISSGAAVGATAGWNAYSISKAALKMMIEIYAAENPDTHFSSVAPGLVDTSMQEYISSLEPHEKFPVIEKLQKARGTEAMPEPENAAPHLVKTFKEVQKEPSGTFTDVRDKN